MRRIVLGCACALLVAAVAFAAAKPTTIRLKSDDVTADVVWEKGGKITVTSKPSPIKPGQYFVKSISLFKKDEKGKVWEMRSTAGGLETLATITVDAEQDKVLMIGSKIAARVAGEPASGGTTKFYIRFIGSSSEMYIPGAFCDGKRPPAPTLSIKDKDGKTVGGGAITVNDAGLSSFSWKVPAGLKGAVTVEVSAQMGPFELVQPDKSITVK